MYLQWIVSSLLFLLYLSVVQTSHILTEISDNSQAISHIFNSSAPFESREIGQATVWNVKETDFLFYIHPKEDCQEVWVCSTGLKAFNTDLKEVSTWCDDYIRFRPMEATVTLELKYNDPKRVGKQFFYPWSKVHFKFVEKTKKYNLAVANGERSIYGDAPEKEEQNVELGIGYPLILTSSPYCQLRIQLDDDTRMLSSSIVNYISMSDKNFELAYPARHEGANYPRQKKFNGLLVPTVVKKYSISTTAKCPKVWLIEFDGILKNYENQEFQDKAVHLLYYVQRRKQKEGQVNCDSSAVFRSSLKLQIENPEYCNWIRLCFFEKDNKLCVDPTKSIELLIAYKMFVGVDSDQARQMDGDSYLFKNIRFEITKDEKDIWRMTMSYGFATDEPVIQYVMNADHLKDWLHASNFYVSLARDPYCLARLVNEDSYLEQDNTSGKQCLLVRKCDVIRPEEYEPFPGHEMINLDDFRPQ